MSTRNRTFLKSPDSGVSTCKLLAVPRSLDNRWLRRNELAECIAAECGYALHVGANTHSDPINFISVPQIMVLCLPKQTARLITHQPGDRGSPNTHLARPHGPKAPLPPWQPQRQLQLSPPKPPHTLLGLPARIGPSGLPYSAPRA